MKSSLSTYLTVVARRVVVRELLKKKSPAALSQEAAAPSNGSHGGMEQRIQDREEVERLLDSLNGTEAVTIFTPAFSFICSMRPRRWQIEPVTAPR